MALRGAEAPLFHGAAHIFEFFRNRFSDAVSDGEADGFSRCVLPNNPQRLKPTCWSLRGTPKRRALIRTFFQTAPKPQD
jgi:hypothetical protein